MTDQLPIPPLLWARITAFLRAGSTGQVVLDVHRGRVTSVSLTDRLRDEPAPIQTPPTPPLTTR